MTFHYVGYSNSNKVRTNYVSSDALAAELNKVIDSQSNPQRVASPGHMGGYRMPILDDIAGDRTYQVLKVALPESDIDKRLVAQLLMEAETVYAYVDQGEVTIVQIDGYNRQDTPLASFGWSVEASAKTFKRLKTLNRPFRLWNKLDRPLRVCIVDDEDYISDDLDTSNFSAGELERLLDGAIVIARHLFTDCLANVKFPEYNPDDMTDHPEMYVDMWRSQEYLRQAQSFRTFNARIFGAMHFIGLEPGDSLHDRTGLLKAEAFCDVGGTCERLNVDVICARSALKQEVSYSGMPYILFEPQKAKKSGVNSDIQTMSNLPAVFPFEDVAEWAENYLAAKFDDLKNDKVMQEWYDMSSPFFNGKSFDLNDVTTLCKWNAREWLMRGRRITESPWLFEQLASAIAKTLSSGGGRRLRFPVPCAIRAQVISASMASMAGFDADVYEGCARWVEELEAVVVNDINWLEMYRSHGGMDLDDFFVCYYRTIGNVPKIVVVRSPNDWGEYSVFDYVPGDWFPIFTKVNGDMIQFPQVTGDPTMWPERLSEVVAEGRISYLGLPTDNAEQVAVERHTYGLRDVMDLVTSNHGSQTCVGANVNARTLHSLSMREHRRVQLCPMESCIDAGTQGGSADDTEAVAAEAKQIIQTVIQSDAKISEFVWVSRFASGYRGVPFGRDRFTSEDHISKAHSYRMQASRRFMAMARKYAQDNMTKKLDIRIHRLGKLRLGVAYECLRETRAEMVSRQSVGDQSLGFGDWRDLHRIVDRYLARYEDELDQYDFILALYSVCFKVPAASSGRVSDQIVMNPRVFPLLMRAMCYYGLAKNITVDETGNIHTDIQDTWLLKCQTCDFEKETDDPCDLQTFNFYHGICKTCREKESQ